MIRDLVKELRIFERNKVPEEIKILGIAIYFQTSSFRRTAKILSELHPVSYNAVRDKEDRRKIAYCYREKA